MSTSSHLIDGGVLGVGHEAEDGEDDEAGKDGRQPHQHRDLMRRRRIIYKTSCSQSPSIWNPEQNTVGDPET